MPPQWKLDLHSCAITVPGPQPESVWDTVIGAIAEHRVTRLTAPAVTGSVLERLSRRDHLTHLDLGGAVHLTDSDLRPLARMQRLQDLDLSGYKGQITDTGLEILRDFEGLRRFQICWQQNITDAGIANLRSCYHLEHVNLLGTPTGDGAIRTLAGKNHLRNFRTGRQVSDAGLPLLHTFPAFKTWQGGQPAYGLMRFDADPSFLLVDGPITDPGLTTLAGLDGLFGLSFFWHCPAITGTGLTAMRRHPRLGFLGVQGENCDDAAMRNIAAMPQLRMLMGQGTVATDAGFIALSHSQSVEYIWGRECPNLDDRGFTALASMRHLRGLAVSCRDVSDEVLALLPAFPALRELMPMDVSDEGFRHVGRCTNLEALWCMYCRDTGDAATEHIAGLANLKSYYAGKTKITDRSLEILSQMPSLERLEFWDCAGLTDNGIAHLARLPRLREVALSSLSGVTEAAASLLPATVRLVVT